MADFDPTGKAVIVEGYFIGSELVRVAIPGGTAAGVVVYLFDEDTCTRLAVAVTVLGQVYVNILLESPLAARRIIAYYLVPGNGTAGGVDVMESEEEFTGWEVAEPFTEIPGLPQEIGFFNPGIEHPITAKFNPELINSIPHAYRAGAISLLAEPISFGVNVTYKVRSSDDAPIAVIQIIDVKNARGATVVEIGEGVDYMNPREVDEDLTLLLRVTDSEARVASRTITVNPVTGYLPVPPAPPVTSIDQFIIDSYFVVGSGYLIRVDARCDDPLEVSYDGGTSYVPMSNSSNTLWGSFKPGLVPGSATVVIRVISSPGDSITRVIPVPYV